eukprot:2590464-Rhodomonas_salina.1
MSRDVRKAASITGYWDAWIPGHAASEHLYPRTRGRNIFATTLYPAPAWVLGIPTCVTVCIVRVLPSLSCSGSARSPPFKEFFFQPFLTQHAGLEKTSTRQTPIFIDRDLVTETSQAAAVEGLFFLRLFLGAALPGYEGTRVPSDRATRSPGTRVLGPRYAS